MINGKKTSQIVNTYTSNMRLRAINLDVGNFSSQIKKLKTVISNLNIIEPKDAAKVVKFILGESDFASLPKNWQIEFENQDRDCQCSILESRHSKIPLFFGSSINLNLELSKFLKQKVFGGLEYKWVGGYEKTLAKLMYFQANLFQNLEPNYIQEGIYDQEIQNNPLYDQNAIHIDNKKNNEEDNNKSVSGAEVVFLNLSPQKKLDYFKKNIITLTGGQHKKFHQGFLYATKQSGQSEFVKEEELSRYCDKQGDSSLLKNVMSFQIQLKGYPDIAYVDDYEENPNQTTLEEALFSRSYLNSEQIKSIIGQVIDSMEVFFANNIMHGDCHASNGKIIKNQDDTVTFKWIDFGKSEFQFLTPANRYADLKYHFHKIATEMGDHINRSLREFTKVGIINEKKHYPLHKLLNSLGIPMSEINLKLNELGKTLIEQLKTNDDHTGRENISNNFKKTKEELFKWINEQESAVHPMHIVNYYK